MSRVVFVSAGFPWRIDYPEARPLMLARDLGHDVHAVSYPQLGRPLFDGVEMWSSGSLGAQLARVARLRPDLVFLERPGRSLLAALAGRRSWVRALEHRGSARSDVPRQVLVRRLDAVSFTNPHEASLWPSIKASQRKDLPYPSDLGLWRGACARSDRFWLDRELDPPTGPVLVSVANILRRKQFLELVSWSAPLLRARPGSRLVLPGHPHDVEEQQRLHALIDDQRLAGQVHLLGSLAPEDVRQLLSWADVHVVNSNNETQCMAMYEALAAGVPTLLFDNPVLTSAFPTLPVHSDGPSYLRNLEAVLADPVGARALIGRPDVQERLDWADLPRHDALFRTHLEELLG